MCVIELGKSSKQSPGIISGQHPDRSGSVYSTVRQMQVRQISLFLIHISGLKENQIYKSECFTSWLKWPDFFTDEHTLRASSHLYLLWVHPAHLHSSSSAGSAWLSRYCPDLAQTVLSLHPASPWPCSQSLWVYPLEVGTGLEAGVVVVLMAVVVVVVVVGQLVGVGEGEGEQVH